MPEEKKHDHRFNFLITRDMFWAAKQAAVAARKTLSQLLRETIAEKLRKIGGIENGKNK